MYPTRRQPSYTLPRNFHFHFRDETAPDTTESTHVAANQTADIPYQIRPYKIRRRKELNLSVLSQYNQTAPRDVPVPTIEVSGSSVTDQPALHHPFSARGVQPRTPAPLDTEQDRDTSRTELADTYSQAESISRPSTACSGFSDSSVSSSVESFPSLGDSLATTDSQIEDTWLPQQRHAQLECDPASGFDRIARRSLPKVASLWTMEMDNHIWITYMRYLQNPIHTPFKMLPGTAPPLGVCARVARDARRTWRLPGKAMYNRGTTPTNVRHDSPKRQPSWPKSDASTRRRLRLLCKDKPSLSAHYTRLLDTRSPSPFSSSSISGSSSLAQERAAPPQVYSRTTDNVFATRDMSFQLFSSTSSAISVMNELTASAVTPRPRSVAHQKSQSLQLNLGLNHHNGPMPRLLASPFEPVNANPKAIKAERDYDARSMLPSNASGSFAHQPSKQPVLSEENGSGDARIELPQLDPDRIPGNMRFRRIRNRAVSMGDVNSSSRRLSLLFEPPVPQVAITLADAHEVHQDKDYSKQLTTAPLLMGLSTASAGSMRRLGSPFFERPGRPLFNTFPRNFGAHGLEPTIELHEERLAPQHHGNNGFDA